MLKKLLLTITVLVFLLATIGGVFKLQQMFTQKKDEVRGTILWPATEVHREYWRFIDSLSRYSLGDDSINKDTLLLRRDLFWGQLINYTNGELGKRLMSDSGGNDVIIALESLLVKSEPQLLKLKHGDTQTGQLIRKDFEEYKTQLHQMTQRIDKSENSYFVEILNEAEETSNYLLLLMILFTFSGTVLITFLIKEMRRATLFYDLFQDSLKLEKITNTIPGVVYQYVLNSDGTDNIKYMSEGCNNIWELDKKSIESDVSLLWNMILEEDKPKVKKSVNYSAKTLEPWIQDYRIITPSGKTKWLQGQGIPQKDDFNNITWNSAVFDITVQKYAQERLEDVTNSIPGAVFQYVVYNDGKDAIKYISKGCEDIWEVDKQTIKENVSILWEMILEEDLPNMKKSVMSSSETLNFWIHEWRIKTASGKIKLLQGRAIPRKDSEGTTTWNTVIFDITELKTTKYELEKQKELVISQSKAAMMGEMISLIAHQWKQPLSVLSMLGSNMKVDIELDQLSNGLVLETVDDIDKQVDHLSKTIDTFRDFLKPNQAKTDTSIESVLDSSLEIVNKSLINNNIKLEKDYNTGSTININPSELMQVIINLLNNSKDAFKINNIQDKKIWIRTIDNEKNIIIEIEDTAGGIPNDKVNKVFDAYFTTKSNSGGTGLGLYIVKTIIEEHLDGTIKVENTPNGVCFYINLPLTIQN